MNAYRRRAALGQNFFRDPLTVRAFVARAGLAPEDRVYDLGAGTGVIAAEVLRTCARVVAVERDPNLARKLRQRFGPRVDVVEGDIADVTFATPYKVVANIPFNRTAAVMRQLFAAGPPPEGAWLVLQREAAEKYAGVGRLTVASLMLQPWFEAAIVRRFRADDFVPRPSVDVVLLHVKRRAQPLLPEVERPAWDAFVHHVLGRCKADARSSFRKRVSHLQWKLLSRDLHMLPGARLDELSLGQWIGIYRFVRSLTASA